MFVLCASNKAQISHLPPIGLRVERKFLATHGFRCPSAGNRESWPRLNWHPFQADARDPLVMARSGPDSSLAVVGPCAMVLGVRKDLVRSCMEEIVDASLAVL